MNGELDNSPCGKLLAKEIKKNKKFVEIYNKSKKNLI
jgi:hypothetical protein